MIFQDKWILSDANSHLQTAFSSRFIHLQRWEWCSSRYVVAAVEEAEEEVIILDITLSHPILSCLLLYLSNHDLSYPILSLLILSYPILSSILLSSLLSSAFLSYHILSSAVRFSGWSTECVVPTLHRFHRQRSRPSHYLFCWSQRYIIGIISADIRANWCRW